MHVRVLSISETEFSEEHSFIGDNLPYPKIFTNSGAYGYLKALGFHVP